MHPPSTKNECEIISILTINRRLPVLAYLFTSIDEELIWFHAVNDHTSCPRKQMENNRRFRGVLRHLLVNPFLPRKMYQLADDVAYPEHSKYDEGILSKRTTCIPLPDMFKRQARDFRRLLPWNFRNPRHPREPKQTISLQKAGFCSLQNSRNE